VNDSKETQETMRNQGIPKGIHKQARENRFRNADNADLWEWDKSPDGGDAPEINGCWAAEIPEFVPTGAELLVLAEHWTDVAIQRMFVESDDAPDSVSTEHWRRVFFACHRLYRIRTLLGDVIDRLIEDRIQKFIAGIESGSVGEVLASDRS
jgi:hypothetical protein